MVGKHGRQVAAPTAATHNMVARPMSGRMCNYEHSPNLHAQSAEPKALNSIAKRVQGRRPWRRCRGIPLERLPSGEFAEGESDEEC